MNKIKDVLTGKHESHAANEAMKPTTSGAEMDAEGRTGTRPDSDVKLPRGDRQVGGNGVVVDMENEARNKHSTTGTGNSGARTGQFGGSAVGSGTTGSGNTSGVGRSGVGDDIDLNSSSRTGTSDRAGVGSGETGVDKNLGLTADRLHDTKLTTSVEPEVVQEHIRPEQREEITKNVVREHDVHHHQQRVQPVTDKQVLETEHQERDLGTEHHHFRNEMNQADTAKLEGFKKNFHDERTTADVVTSQVEKEGNVSEKFHHHVHESIQPVIQRETIAPSVVHTRGVVHEHHHDAPLVHDHTVEKPITMDDFKSRASALKGGEEAFVGEAKPNVLSSENAQYGGDTGIAGGKHHHSHGDQYGSGTGTGTSGTLGDETQGRGGQYGSGTGQTLANEVEGRTGTGHTGSGLTGSDRTGTGNTGSGLSGTGHTGTGHTGTGTGQTLGDDTTSRRL